MKDLIELANVVSRYKIKNIETLGSPSAEDTLYKELYKLILEGKVSSDKEGISYFYGSLEKDYSKFSKLKYNLKRKLINTTFFIDVSKSEYNEQQKAYYYLWKEFAAIKILTGKTAYGAVISMLKKVLKKAIEFEFVDLAKEAAKEVVKYYGNINGDQKLFEHYLPIYEKYSKEANADEKAEILYSKISVRYLKSKDKGITKTLNLFVRDNLKEIHYLIDNYNAPRIHLCCRLMLLLMYLTENNYSKGMEVCENAIVFFQNKKYTLKTNILIFLNRQLIISVLLKDFKNGRVAANKSLKIAEGYNYFWNRKYYFILCTYSKEYEEAYQVIVEFFTQNQWPLPEHLKESWLLYKAYTQYLISLNKITPPSTSKKFRLGKFLNEVPEFSKDKRGMNIPILIIQILFLIHRKKHDAAIDRIESLQWYGAKHIRKDENFRTNCFIKMLGQLPKAGFSPKRAERYADKYYQKLLTMPIDKADQAFEIEVIPYEDLWELVIESL